MNNERKDETSVYSVGSQNQLVPIRSRRTYFKKRTKITKLQMIILIFLWGVLFILVLALLGLYARGLIKICDSEDCVRIAASLKESMNASVNPCDDFYQYACGRWPQEHPIPDSSLTNSWFSERSDRVSRKIRDLLKSVNVSAAEVPQPVMQAKTLFISCMDTRSMNELDLSPLIDLLEILNLPMIPAALTNKTANYIEQSAKVKRILGRDIFFGFDIMPDPRNNSRNVLYLDVPEEGSPFPSINKELERRLQTIRSRLRKLEDLDDESMIDENEDAELVYMTDVIKQIISNGTFNDCTAESEFKPEILTEFVETIYNISNILYLCS